MERSAEEVWEACLDRIREQVNRQSFKTWFEPLSAQSIEQEENLCKLTIQLPSRFYYEWLEEHYYSLLRKTVTQVLGEDGRLFYDIVVEPEDAPASSNAGASSSVTPSEARSMTSSSPVQSAASSSASSSASPAEAPSDSADPDEDTVRNPFAIPGIQKATIDSQLNSNYTFGRFIQGDCNRLARSAAWAIAQEPGGTSFNPFLVYGGVGLGKTHLIQSIGNQAKETETADTVLYVSSERFTTEFVQSIQRNRISEFSMFYRQIDLLIVDDVQFFSGKEKTQEEFFHIFNALHQSGKQIVLSADRPPREIDGIEERLLSRFQWGLSADVQPPGLETRIAILQRKAEDDNIDLDQEVIEFIAHNIKSNIRELEGALIRLMAHASLHQRDLDLDLAKEVLRDLMQDVQVNLTIEEIQRIVCESLDINEDLIRAKTRKREVVRARQIAMYFCKEVTQHSLKTIGLHFGGRDHSTVIHAVKTVEDQVDTDSQFRDMVDQIGRKIELRAR
ncbi:MAG: chromosomal replication initiator protein DnaA [Longimonas sp.]|uniref:chromosomal replication initiator protein DnaA n=1 Tax=Longimonas sp. TaxID=2039626 RepID=UPI003975BEEC